MDFIKKDLLIYFIAIFLVSFGSNVAKAELPLLSKIVTIYGVSSTGSINSYSTIKPDGSTAAYQIPSGQALVITSTAGFFTPNTQDSTKIGYFVIGKTPYPIKISLVLYGSPMTIGSLTHGVGFAISDINALTSKIIDTAGNTVAGQMEIRIYGYHTSLSTNIIAPTMLLLGRSRNVIFDPHS